MKSVFTFTLFTLVTLMSYAQPCTIQGFASPTQISCGDSVTLSAFGNGAGNVAFQENFNSGSPVGWQFTQTVTIASNTCGVPAPDGSPFMWMGDASVNPRDMTTVAFDLTLGGTICFEMRYSVQGDASPCEGPDEPQEGVYLQYSTNGGANWTNINYFDPNGGNDPQLTSWNQYCFVIPPAAMTPNTMIRWHQDNVSGAEYDHWGIDNVIITLNDPNFVISWLHDGYSYGPGSSGGVNPTMVYPSSTTTYTVQITDGTNTCTDQVQVVVTNPVFVVDAGADTTVCPGECITLDATAYWQVEPAGPRPFVNDIPQTINSSVIGSGSIDIPIVVSGLNLGNIQSGDIAEVCITNMTYYGFQFPASTLTIGVFEIVLECPGGSTITLVPSGVTSNTSASNGYTNTCFSMASSIDIATASTPYTNTYAPEESFDGLNGCSANGTWTMSLLSSGFFSFGSGDFDGWSITFNDPGLVAPVNFSWSPTTAMTNSNTLSPTVCPNQTTTYTLTAFNSANCPPTTDNVTITIPNSCCNIQYDNVNTQNPACGVNNGQISITVTGATTGLEYSIDNGATWQASNSFTGLAPGTYTVVVQDDNNCPIYQTVVLSNPNPPLFGNITTTDNTSCQTPNGSIVITAAGGSGAGYTFSLNSGALQASGTFNNLAAGTYTVTLEDGASCVADTTIEIEAPSLPNIVSITAIGTDCGQDNGSATVIVSGGSTPYTYAWTPTAQTTATASNLPAGNYSVTVTDGSGCEVSAQTEVNVIVTDSLLSFEITTTPETCAGNDGSAAITVLDGVPPYSYSWSGNTSDTTFAYGYSEGSYWVTVTDQCYSDSLEVLIEKEFTMPVADLPNIFTPNGDGTNDVYTTGTNFQDTQNFLCHIYNRWGNLMYKTENKSIDWKPKKITDGVYFIVITYTDCLGEPQKLASNLTVSYAK